MTWRTVTLRDIGQIIGGGTPSTKEPAYFGDDYSWITPKDLSRQRRRFISSGERGLSAAGLASSSAKILPAGTVISGFNEEGLTYSPNYATEVLPLGKCTFRASVAWLVERGALSAEQAGQLDAISDHRHEIAHELARLLVDPESSIDTSQLSALIDVLHSLDIFWGTIELETSEGIDPDQIDYQGIRSGWGLLLDYLAELSELKNVTNAKAGH